MTTVHRIADLELPELAPYRTMRFQEEQRGAGVFVAEGDKVVRRLLESSLEVVSIVLPENWLPQIEPLAALREGSIPVYVAPRKALEKLTGFSLYQGVMALGRIPESPALEGLMPGDGNAGLILALHALTGPDNLGSLMRSAVGFGVHGILTGETSCSPWLRRAVRASMGECFKVPVRESKSLRSDLMRLKESGYRIVAAHPHAEGGTLPCVNLAGSVCLLLGSEGPGLSPELLEVADDRVAAPMANGVDSLNVSVAGGVFLYESWRQRSAQTNNRG